MTRPHLAAAAGLSDAHLARIEAGSSDLTVNTLARLATALGTTPFSFFSDPIFVEQEFLPKGDTLGD